MEDRSDVGGVEGVGDGDGDGNDNSALIPLVYFGYFSQGDEDCSFVKDARRDCAGKIEVDSISSSLYKGS